MVKRKGYSLPTADMEMLRRRSIRELKAIAGVIPDIIHQKKFAPNEDDIAREHTGVPDLIAEVLYHVQKGAGYSNELQKIYCSVQRCPCCPHGPFWYFIRVNKRRGTRVVRYTGKPVFPWELLQERLKQVKASIADSPAQAKEVLAKNKMRM